MTSEQRRQESEDYWFNSTEARNVLEDFVPPSVEEETILAGEGQEPDPVQLDTQTRAEDIVRNEAQPERIQLETLPEDFDVDAAWSSIENKDADDEFAKLGLERPRGESIVPEEERGIIAEGMAGGARGIDQTQAMGFGLLGLMGEALQVEGLSDLGVEGYKRNMEEAAKNQASVQDPFEEIGGVGDAALYATGVLSEQLPQLLVSLLGGGVGGYTAKTIAKKVVANEIGKRVAAGMAKEEAEKVVSKLVAQRALQGFDVPLVREGVERMATGVGQEALQQATKAGALGGAYVANVGQIAGGSFGEIEQETGLRDPVNALGFALLGGALETGAEALMLAPVANKLIGGRTVSKLADLDKPSGAAATLVRGTGRLAGTSVAEGGTEYSQTFTEQAAVASADPNRTLAEVAFTPEAERERQIAGAAGVVAGGGIGAVSQAASYLIPETSRRVNEVLQQRQQQQQGQEEIPQQESPADEEWSEPVTIASRNEDYNGLEYRRNKAGQVWAFNVPEVSRFGAFAIPTKYGQGVLLNPAFEGASDIRSEVKAKLAEMADPEAFKAPPVTPPKKIEENLEDADLVEGDETAVDAEAIAAAAERRRLRDQEILTRDLESAAATLARPQEDAKGFVDSLKEGDQVSVLTEDGEGNAFAIPMTFVRLNQNGQAQLRSEPDEDNKVATRLYDADEFNRITTRPAPAATTGTGVKVSPLTAPIRPAAEGEQLSEAERAQNLLYFKDVEGLKIDDNLWINSARELGVEITPETTGAIAEQEIRNRFGVERTTTKQDDPASQVLMDALGPNPTKQKLESMTGTRWTGKGSKFTWMLPDKLGGKGIPVTTRFFNRKAPAEALPIPERSTTRGFKPEEQGGTAPAAPDIQAIGPDLIAKSSAEFVGVRKGEKNELVSVRPTRGQDNATYLQEVDTAADTTIRQMNYLGQPVLVTPETAQSLAEANQFWTEHEQRQKAGTAKADRQPVRFYTQERSDKDGNRNTFITGVTYEGRTYRVGKTPQEFSVDRALTQRGSKSRRRGLGIYDPIRIASPSRIARSEAGMAAAKTEAGDGPLTEALRGVQGRAAIAELNEAENAVYGFFDAKITNPILNIQDPAVTTEVRDAAMETARGKVAAAFLKVKQANPSETTKVLPGRQRTIGEKVAERLTAYQEAKRAKAIQALRDKFKGIREKTASAKAGARGTGTAKALKMTPQGAMNLITRARRGQKTGIAESKRMTRDEAMTELQELVDFGALDQEKKDAQIKRILDKADKFTEIERDEMQQSIISELAKEDKAAAAKQGRKYSRSEAQVAQERRLVLSTINLLDDPAIRTLSPYRIGNSALSAAKRTATRKGMTRDEISLDDETQGAGNEVALKASQPDDQGRIDQAKLAERGKRVGVEDAEGGEIAPFTNNIEEALNLMDELPDSDRDLFLRYAGMEIERQAGERSQTNQPLSEVDRLWAGRIKSYLDGKINRSQLEYFRNEERRLVERTTPRATPTELTNLRRGVSNEAALSGVAESRAARTPDPAPTGRAERVVGSPADPAGTVQESTAGQTGGRGVQPTPRRTRAVAAAAQRDFAGAILGLDEAETAALPQGTVDRVYQSYLATLDGVLAEQGNNPLTASAAPAADTVTADGKKMFERFAAARLNPDQQRAAIIRSNMAQAYRAGLFDEDPVMSAINKIATDKTQPMNLRLMAKEFSKNAKRGVRFDRVVLDIGRFTKPGNKQTTWAGLFSLTPEGAPVVSVNLDNLHDKNSVPLTFLHELQHVVIRDKVRRAIPLTRAEEQALARLEDLRGQAVIAAARQQGIEVGATPDVNALAEQLYALTDPNSTQSGAAVDNRRLAGLVNLEEFVIEMIGNPDMVRLLSELGFGEARTDGKRFSLTGALRNAWNAVVELITGVKVDPNSPLAMAFKDSWTVNFGTGRSPNITEIKASKRLADRQQAQTRQQYVEGEIEARDMAGTSRDRNRIMQEITGPADAETNAMRASMLDAARSMTEDQWVAAARAQGFNFVDPGAVYRQARAEAVQAAPEQATGDTVQVAESRALGSQTVVVPDPKLPNILQPKEYHKLVNYTDDEGYTRLDSGALLESMKQKASNVDGRVYGKKYAVRIMDEVLEFGTFPSLKKYFDAGGFSDGLVVEVYRNGNNQIVADFEREDTNPSIRNYFNRQAPQIAESRAVGRPFASDTATTYNGKTYTRPGLIFGENANLDPRATELVSILKRVKRAAEQYANLKGKELNRLIRKLYKNQPVPTDLINDALGNLDNPLTDQQFDEVKRLELTDPEAAVAKRMAYISENRARFRTERQAPALLALPEELAEFLREIGGSRETPGDLYRLQEEALKLGIPKGDMATAFSENLGIYLTRSYNAFIDQAKWEETLRREDRELGEQSRMGQFRNLIRTTLIGQRADDLLTKAQDEGRTLSRAEAERLAKEGTTTEEVDQMLESYIAYTKEEASSESFSGLRLPGRQNIKSLEQRKLLSDALREFYGQVENPAVNFVTSYAKLSSLVANHQFQTELKNLGLKEGWIWDPEKNRGQRPPSGYERIAADNDKSLKVLAGLYARSDLVRGLRETFPPNSMEAAQWWLHPFMKLTGFSMGMKTVGSIASQIRNYWSSYAPVIAGGNFTIADFFRPEWRKNWKEAHGVSIANVFRNYKGDREAITKRIKRLYELGVMGESLTVGLLNDLTRLGKDASINDEQFFNNFEKILKKPGRRVWNATKQVWEKAEQIYGMTDDIFKIFTYLSEFDKYKKIYPNMADADLERKAADIARDIHWTYSKAPAIVNELKKFPFIAPFITFTTETIRITANLGKLAINERKEGQRLREQGLRENNAELVRQGDEFLKISNKRLRGMAAVAVGPWALGAMAMTAAGFSGDDEEDLRQFLPDWQKNSQLIIIGKNGSEVNYVDVSYLDPFEVWKKPMTAFMRGLGRAENVEEFFTEAVVGAAIEAGRPFTSEQILSGAIMDVMRNRDANGRQVYNPQDTGTAIASAVGSKLASAFAPGTLDTGERIVKAFGGQISETGRDYNLANEVFGVPFGSRVSAVDAEQALGFKASQFLRARRDARSIFNRDYLSRGSRSESDVISAYQRSNVGLREVTERLRREYIAALNLGVSPARARSVLRASGLDRDSARMVSTGIYRRLTPSEEQDRMAAPERKRAARQAIADTPQREVLFP